MSEPKASIVVGPMVAWGLIVLMSLPLLAGTAYLLMNFLDRHPPPEYLFPLGALLLQAGVGIWWVRRRGIREAMRLKRTTWILLACLVVVLASVQVRLSDFYWTGAPLLFNLTAGLALLGGTTLVVESRLRVTGRLLFRPDLPMHVILAVLVVLIVALNFIPGYRVSCFVGPSGGCEYAHTYGFPSTLASRPFTPLASSVPQGITWDGTLDDCLGNVLFLLAILAAAGYGLEQVRRRPLVGNRGARRLALAGSTALSLSLCFTAWPMVRRAFLTAVEPYPIDRILWPRMTLSCGLWTILFLIGVFGIVETLRRHGVPGRIRQALHRPVPPESA